MKPSIDLAHKGAAIEEWADVKFFRPLGIRVARLLEPTSVSADQVTLACVIIGIVAGHLFAYSSVTLNLVGVLLFIVSDVLDSSDGQLARIRGTSSRFGRMLDGIADTLRFFNLYIHLLFRSYFAHWGWQGYTLVLAAGFSHSLQGQIVDFIKNAYQRLGEGKGELDLPEELAPITGGPFARLIQGIYHAYVNRQERLFPGTLALVRATPRPPSPSFREAYVGSMAPLLVPLPLIAQNIRFVLLALGAVYGMSWFTWMTIVPLNLVAATVLVLHERRARALLPNATAIPVRG